jgi:hypothetical protein
LTTYSFYREKIEGFEKTASVIQKRINLISLCRMLVFLALAFNFYWYIQKPGPLLMSLGLLIFIGFLLLLRYHFQLRDKLLLVQKLLFVNRNELNILEDRPNGFGDGSGILIPGGTGDDLDIFGPNSLYHFLNRTTTVPGTRRLASMLSGPPPSPGRISRWQEAVQILGGQREIAQRIQAYGLMAEKKEENIDPIAEWVKSPARLLKSSAIRWGSWIIPVYNFATLLFWILDDNYWPLVAGISASWILIQPFKKYIDGQHQLLSNRQPLLDQYVSILKTFHSLDAEGSIQISELKEIAGSANLEIHRLSRLASAFDQRTNLVVKLLLNSLLVYDIQCILALEKWKEKNREQCPGWLSCIGEIESLNSMAAFAFNHPDAFYPVLSEGQIIIEATQLAHPLIPEKERVANDFSIGKQGLIQLVTGSNMSGKTTFLRTIAVNLLIAQCGAPVIATYFSFQPMQILSSLRIQDSLHEHSSYFLAELKKLQHIIHCLEAGGPAIVLIDEILKGTNSEDKTMGSGKFLEKLLQYNCLCLFATHDLALSRMEEEFPGRISNYCFESQIRNGELIFDYILKRGVAKNKNASFLMQKMGII